MLQQKIRICHIVHSLQVGGAELLLLSVCRELQAQSPGTYAFTVVATSDSGPLQQEFEQCNIPVISLNLSGKRFWTHIWRIHSAIMRVKPDIVHSHLLPADKYGQIAAFLAGVRHRVSTVHSMEPNVTRFEHGAIAVVRRLAEKQIAVSEGVKSHLVSRHRYDPSRITVIHNAPSFAVLESGPREIAHPVRLINLANLKEAKGQVFIIPAALEIQKTTDSFCIDLVGDAQNEYGRNVARLISANRLDDRVVLRGRAPDPASIIPQYSIMISLSIWEGFGISIVEGMCAGLPLILSDIPAHREIVEGIDNFPFVHHDSPKEIAGVFGKLVNDPSFYSDMSRKMIARSRDFSLEKMIAKYHAFYRGI